jgi:hypothetical protein
MPANAACRHKNDLQNQEENPRRKYDGMNVDDQAGKLGLEHASQVIGMGKTKKYGRKNDACHSGEKLVVETLGCLWTRNRGNVVTA